ncbi:translocation protein SEC62-like [Amphiura filiformis]|uniref:translocation protein SEC62-like n=1 Tax=Amphiura filiformis TaxID=82378 RepID=UPI003B213B73
MADRSVRRRKKKEEDDEKPNEEETAVGKHVRFNLATKTSKIGGHKVEYFTGSKAVDFLLDSKWASGEKGTKIIFTDRNSVARYLNELLYKGMFYRALKVVKKNKKEKEEEKKEKKPEKKEKKEKTKEKEKKDEKGSSKDNEKEESGKKTKEGKRKVRLEPTDDQFFADGNDAYVWVFDPIKPMYYVYGALLVIGAIAVCLFPLWPHWMRIGTYYTSLGGAGLVGSVLVLAVFRLIIFCMAWTTTVGKIHFWLFPNLLADVGILESFQPVYICDYMSGDKKDEKDDNEENEDKDEGKEDDSENSKNDTPEELKAQNIEVKDLKQTDDTISKDASQGTVNITEEQEEAEEENEGSSKSGSSAENGQEGFEFIEQEEISEASQEQEPEDSS